MPTSVRVLIDQLIMPHEDGLPSLVVVDDYRQRQDFLKEMIAEAHIHGITLVSFDDAKALEKQAPSTSADDNQALAFLVNAGQAVPFGEWLDTHRDRLRAWGRFTLVFVLRTELASLLRSAPAFFSLVKARIVENLDACPPTIAPEEVTHALAQMTIQTGMTPSDYARAWQADKISDTFQHNYWFHLAQLQSGAIDE